MGWNDVEAPGIEPGSETETSSASPCAVKFEILIL